MTSRVASERTDTPAAAPAAPRGRRLTQRQRTAIALAVLAVVFLIPLRGLLRAQGPPMEEGFMLVFPERVLKGDLPSRDFLHLYGPGGLWALAGWFWVFGTNLISERMFGLLQQMAIVFGIFGLARYWGRIVAVLGALASAVIIIPAIGLTALAWVGAVGLGLLGLLAGVEARRASGDRRARRLALLGGVLLGVALLFRLDLVVAIGLGLVVLLRGMEKGRAHRLLAGLAAGVSLYVIELATSGPGHVIRGIILDPIVYLRGGRRLPIPPSWSHLDGFLQRAGALEQLSWPIPSPTTAQQLFFWFVILLGSVATLVTVGIWAFRRDHGSLRARVLLMVALFSVGLLPQGIQRVDSTHFAWVGCVPLGFLPVAVFELARHRWARAGSRGLALASGAGVLAVLFFVLPFFTFRWYSDYSLQSIGIHRTAHIIKREGRVFYYGKKDRADAAQLVIDEAAKISKPGDRLFVGPKNLRKTPYSDAYLYYMLPELTPATYYIEMDPGVANKGSRLAHDLASADIVILSSIWDNWSEPNDSRELGSRQPEKVLRRDFCHVANYLDRYDLYRRCQQVKPPE
jgi:hypothetical protein